MASSFSSKRLSKELSKIHDHTPPGITFVDADTLYQWHMDIEVLDPSNVLYCDRKFRLRFRFNDAYPIEPPEVVFVLDRTRGLEVPVHPHVYSNGIICLDLLDRAAWSPVHNVESVCISLQSMLTGNERNERPANDEEFVRTNSRAPRDIRFYFHDDGV